MTERFFANRCAHAIVHGHGPGVVKPGLAFVVIVNETTASEGHLQVDACVECGEALTERGGALIVVFARRLRAMTLQLAKDLADESDATYIERGDLEQGADELERLRDTGSRGPVS